MDTLNATPLHDTMDHDEDFFTTGSLPVKRSAEECAILEDAEADRISIYEAAERLNEITGVGSYYVEEHFGWKADWSAEILLQGDRCLIYKDYDFAGNPKTTEAQQ